MTDLHGLRFSNATPDDIERIVGIHNANAIQNLAGDEQGFLLYEINTESIRQKIIEGNEYRFFTARNPDRMVGFLQVHNGISAEEWDEFQKIEYSEDVSSILSNRKKHIHILTVAVIPELKHGGIGGFLYQNLFNSFAGYFFTAFIATSPYNNDTSVQFHKNLGFREVASFTGDADYKIKNYRSIFLLRDLDY